MLELTFEDHPLTFGNHPLTFEDHPLTAGSITLDEMEEVVGILYNLDGCEKVLIITTINVNIAITIITSSFLPFTFCPRLQKGSYLSTKKTTALGQNPKIVLIKTRWRLQRGPRPFFTSWTQILTEESRRKSLSGFKIIFRKRYTFLEQVLKSFPGN